MATFRDLTLPVLLAGAIWAPSSLWGEVTVFAAASLSTALQEIADQYGDQTGQGVTLSFAGSSVLARQIEQGAPADLFLSANAEWMDWLAEGGLIDPCTRHDLLGNRLVLVAHGDMPPVDISSELDLPALLDGSWLAMALVEAVPAGIYGREALVSLGLWDDLAPRVAQTDNVRAALTLVSVGEAQLGIVYETDARATQDVSVIGSFPAESHSPIVYPVAAIEGRATPEVLQFLAYLDGPEARSLWRAHGFSLARED